MASTYVNDLRLNEMATGDASGTWGTITNTNLELIAEAFSFGTEAITTNADTHTTTIADGATDPGRSIFLKYTGTLDSACTITIGPNTVSKFWVIENATSGSQNIIIKQGSGATVTIPNGEVKAIYSDGAGSGGAMVDAFANLKVSDAAQTNITSLGTLTTLTVDDITINGSTISDGADLTVDVEGDITLDANGGDLIFKDDGTSIAKLSNNSSDLQISVETADKDIKFNGTDGSSGITALTLDMSEAGAATFNSGATFGGAVSGTSADFDGGVTIDDITIDGTEIDLSSGSLTIDVADDIVLDADGGTIVFKDGGTEIAFLSLDNSGFFDIYSSVSDNDIRIRGNDGGSTVDAVIFDMSEEGNATFNKNIIFGDNGKALFGAGTDLAIFSDGTDGLIQAGGDLKIDTAGSDLRLLSSGTQYGSFSVSSSDFLITASIQDKDMIFRGNDGGSGINALTLDMSEAGAATFNNNVTAFSDERLKDNIETLEDGLAKVEQLRGVTYTRDGRENIGVIAQEVEKILPEIVLTADDEMGTKSVDYSRITAVLIEAVKDLSARVKELENK